MKKEIVNSKAYRLVAPKKFEEVTLQHTINNHEVVVQPSMASICHADLRYYTGQRRKEALKRKLPMALLHEGIGQIVQSKDNSFKKGQRVVIIPNIPEKGLRDNNLFSNKRKVADNYSPNSIFLGSGYDGIGQEYLVLPTENVISIPDDVPDEVAVLAELTSVSLNAISYVSDCFYEGRVAVFGDGPVGYLTAAALHHVYGVSKENLIVFGAAEEKLAHFDFATTYHVQDFDFKKEKDVVAVMECTGGNFSETAVNQAIDLIEPQGKVILMGVTEERVPINTRDVLEKGLTLYGSSRSTPKDFKTLMESFREKKYQCTLKKLLPHQNKVIHNASDFKEVMDNASNSKTWEKVVLSFKW